METATFFAFILLATMRAPWQCQVHCGTQSHDLECCTGQLKKDSPLVRLVVDVIRHILQAVLSKSCLPLKPSIWTWVCADPQKGGVALNKRHTQMCICRRKYLTPHHTSQSLATIGSPVIQKLRRVNMLTSKHEVPQDILNLPSDSLSRLVSSVPLRVDHFGVQGLPSGLSRYETCAFRAKESATLECCSKVNTGSQNYSGCFLSHLKGGNG